MLSCRSLKDSIFRIGFFSNKTVFIGIAAVLALQALFIYAPADAGDLLHLPVDCAVAWLSSALAGAIILPGDLGEKLIRNRRRACEPPRVR